MSTPDVTCLFSEYNFYYKHKYPWFEFTSNVHHIGYVVILDHLVKRRPLSFLNIYICSCTYICIEFLLCILRMCLCVPLADVRGVKTKQGDDMSPIRRSVLEDLLRGRQSDLGFQELMLRAQSLE